MKKITKSQVLKKGKEIFVDTHKFNLWLNSDIESMGCKPVSLWDQKNGLDKIYNELMKL